MLCEFSGGGLRDEVEREKAGDFWAGLGELSSFFVIGRVALLGVHYLGEDGAIGCGSQAALRKAIVVAGGAIYGRCRLACHLY